MSDSRQSPLLRSASSLLALAIFDLYPTARKVRSGGSEIDFFCDFVFEQRPHLDLIAEKMRAFIKGNVPIEGREMMREAAAELFNHFGQPLLAEKIGQRDENIVSVVQIGDFFDDSPGEHLVETGQMGPFKLLEMMEVADDIIRIRGLAADDKQALKKVLKRVEGAKGRDPIKLGREDRLFTQEEGHWVFHPKGAALWEVLRRFWIRELQKQNFSLVKGAPFSIYQSFEKRQDDLPFGLLTEGEKEGDFFDPKVGLLGLERCHIGKETLFCTTDQLVGQLISSLQFIHGTVRIFGFQCELYFIESNENTALTTSMVQALKQTRLDYQIGGSAEEPRVEIRVFDTLGRSWPMSYVEVTEPAGLSYIGLDEKKHRPCVILRSTLGPWERLIGLLTEHFAGQFPFWLSPQQVQVIPVGLEQRPFAEAIKEKLVQEGYRAAVDSRDESLGQRVKEAQKQRLPAVIVLGEREREKELVTVRFLRKDEVMREITITDLLYRLQQEEKND